MHKVIGGPVVLNEVSLMQPGRFRIYLVSGQVIDLPADFAASFNQAYEGSGTISIITRDTVNGSEIRIIFEHVIATTYLPPLPDGDVRIEAPTDVG